MRVTLEKTFQNRKTQRGVEIRRFKKTMSSDERQSASVTFLPKIEVSYRNERLWRNFRNTRTVVWAEMLLDWRSRLPMGKTISFRGKVEFLPWQRLATSKHKLQFDWTRARANGQIVRRKCVERLRNFNQNIFTDGKQRKIDTAQTCLWMRESTRFRYPTHLQNVSWRTGLKKGPRNH